MIAPQRTERPKNAAALSELLAAANAGNERVAITGGNTLRGMGYPVDASLAISTLSLKGIVEDNPGDLTIAVGAGTTVAEFNAHLAKHNTFVPLDAPQASAATVGGTLAAGWLGPRRHRYGRTRDFLLGSVAVLADGTVARAGGMVVKNVAGYDMSRLYGGSFGTLCVLTQANFKTLPAPQGARMCVARLPEYTRQRAIALCSELAIAPSAAWWVSNFKTAIDGEDGTEGRLLVLLEESEPLLTRATRDVRSALGKAGIPETLVFDSGVSASFGRILDAYTATIGERSITYRIAGDVEQADARRAQLTQLTAQFELRTDLLIDVMNGDIILRVSDLDARTLASKIEIFDDALHDAEPYAAIIAGDHPSRPVLNVWGAPPDGLDRMRALKERFDPARMLNPGRFIGGI